MPSIYIQYEKKYIPDIVQVQILGSDSSYYYWDYVIKKEDYLNFLLPSDLRNSSETYDAQINFLWRNNKSNKLIGNKQYNFKFKVIPK